MKYLLLLLVLTGCCHAKQFDYSEFVKSRHDYCEAEKLRFPKFEGMCIARDANGVCIAETVPAVAFLGSEGCRSIF